MKATISIISLTIMLICSGATAQRSAPGAQEFADRAAISNDEEKLNNMLEEAARMRSQLPDGECVEAKGLAGMFDKVISDAEAMKARGEFSKGVMYLQGKLAEVRKFVKNIMTLDSRLRRAEKKIDEVTEIMQSMEGEDYQKMESVLNRIRKMMAKVKDLRQKCEIQTAMKLLRDIGALAKKHKGKFMDDINKGKRLTKILNRNDKLIEKLDGKIEGEKELSAFARARDLQGKARDLFSTGEFKKSFRSASAARDILMKIGKGALSEKDIQKIKEKFERRRQKTEQLLTRLSAALGNSDNPKVQKALKNARQWLNDADDLFQKRKALQAFEKLQQAHKILTRLKKVKARGGDVSKILARLEAKLNKLSRLLKDSESEEAVRAFENAKEHYNKAKKLKASGDDQAAARQAQLAIRLLGKAVHIANKKDPRVKEEIARQVKETGKKIKEVMARAKASDNKKALRAARAAYKKFSRAKALYHEKRGKRALKLLAEATALVEKAENLLAQPNTTEK